MIKEIHFWGSFMPLAMIEELNPEKPSIRPSKWPQKLKLLKIVNCQNCQKTVLSQLEKLGGHRYPFGSLVIIELFLGLRQVVEGEHKTKWRLWDLDPF
jgi:hypothetical protein